MQGRILRCAAPILAACLLISNGVAQILEGQPKPSIEATLARFNTPAPPPYRAFRRLDGGLTGSASRQGWLEAWTEFVPGKGFSYDVVSEGGHEYVRNKVLRNLLNNERELLVRGKPLRAPFVAANYHFADGGVTEGGLRRVVLKANRKSDGIVNGSLLMDPESGALVQLEGRLLKSPSFWVRDVDVTWKYEQRGGYDLPVEMISAGRVRLLGRSTFKMTYQYESIDGRPINGGAR